MICRVMLKDKVKYNNYTKSGNGRFRGTFEVEEIEVVQTCGKKR